LPTLQNPPLDFLSVISDISVMTEITEKTVKLPGPVERFVLQWGDMGGQWGVNRSVSQIHALLYLSERPLTAEEIAAALGLARSNVSTSIRELMAWNLIRRVPVKGDRREHFEAETDPWEIAMRIAAIRKERELDPALEALRACVADAERDPKLHPVAAKRLNDMLAFVDAVDRWHAQMLTVPKPKLAALIRLGTRIVSLLPLGKQK
jgi:DNA-binding transcriptional regulator GbsR (MarR family)